MSPIRLTLVLLSPHFQARPKDNSSLVVESAVARVLIPHPVRAVVVGTPEVDAVVVIGSDVMGVVSSYHVVLHVAGYPGVGRGNPGILQH